MSYEENLKALGITLPEAPKPVAAYVPGLKVGNFIYTSGQLPMVNGSLAYTGKVGREVSVKEAYEAAKICAINCLSVVRSLIGSLDNVKQVIKVVGFVSSAAGFTQQPQVVNGASELLEKVFGSAGVHARSAVGVAELPLGAPVEVEMIIEIK